MTRVAVISSVFGAYDQIAAPAPQTIEADWVLVADRPPVIDTAHPWPWQVVTEPRPGVHPRLAAKVAKCRPDWYADADVYVWIDASFQIASPDFLAWCLRKLDGAPLAQIPHPVRRCISEEALASAGMAKYTGLPLLEQVAHYRKDGHPADWGLWATGLIVYRRETCARLGDPWLAEQLRWSYQDQLSEPPLLRHLDLRPAALDGALWDHPHFRIRAHASDL